MYTLESRGPSPTKYDDRQQQPHQLTVTDGGALFQTKPNETKATTDARVVCPPIDRSKFGFAATPKKINPPPTAMSKPVSNQGSAARIWLARSR